jgi:hypothetical protein
MNLYISREATTKAVGSDVPWMTGKPVNGKIHLAFIDIKLTANQ